MQQDQNLPLISIILPVRNAGRYLQACLESISQQTYRHFEIIAIDDFSSDESFTILNTFRKKEKRLHIFRNVKRYGPAITLNRALKKAQGQLIAFLKAEDISHKDRFKKQLAFLQGNKKVVGVGTQCYFLDENGKRIGKSIFPTESLQIYQKPVHGISVQFEGMLINRLRIPKDLLYFHTNLHPFLYSDILVKLLQYGKLANLPYYLYNHRKFGTENRTKLKQLLLTTRLWLRSETRFGHRPALKNFMFPLLRIKATT